MTMRTLPTASRRIGLGLVLLVFCSPIIIAAIAAKKDQTFSQIKGATERKMNIQEVTSPGGIKAWLVEGPLSAACCCAFCVSRRCQSRPG